MVSLKLGVGTIGQYDQIVYTFLCEVYVLGRAEVFSTKSILITEDNGDNF